MSRAELVAAAGETIARGSQSFASASRIFDRQTRERAWLLYAWCRAADDMTDGQELGHGATSDHDPVAAQAELDELTHLALASEKPVPLPFAALRQVARETAMPQGLIADHLAGFALDADQWRPQDESDLLRYCYHVAGSVGCMMAVVMGVDPEDADTLDRACDLGLAFQLANIARDLQPDAQTGRCYVPAEWLNTAGIAEDELAEEQHRPRLAEFAARLVGLASGYRRSARIGAARLPLRSRLAVLAADAIYGAIGERVVGLGPHAWDRRTFIGKPAKLLLIGQAAARGFVSPPPQPRDGLWTRPRYSLAAEGSRS